MHCVVILQVRLKLLPLLLEWDVRQGPQPGPSLGVQFRPTAIKQVSSRGAEGEAKGEGGGLGNCLYTDIRLSAFLWSCSSTDGSHKWLHSHAADAAAADAFGISRCTAVSKSTETNLLVGQQLMF